MSRQTDRLLDIMARLRDPDGGCPWDLEQTFATIAPHTIEEAYEVADAIERGDMPHLKNELGDLMLQVVFHARMAEEHGHFTYEDVVGAICEKMLRRHPHVFASATIATADAQTRAWEDQKAEERRRDAARDGRVPRALDGVTPGLPALTRALKLQRRAARVGFDWDDERDVLNKIVEEIDEFRDELNGGDRARMTDELGDILFALVNLARRLDIDPESALRHGNTKFETRFRAIEDRLRADGRRPEDSSLEEMDALWREVKHKVA